MKVGVIISTYNEPAWLQKVLWGYEVQTFSDFEIIIADDGSDHNTQEVINQFQNSNLRIKHIWHPRNGYQKCRILNKAISATDSEYIIFSDGDCIPRKDFVECHVMNARPGYFLSGGAIRLPMNTSLTINHSSIVSQECFDINWLLKAGLENKPLKNLKLTSNKTLAEFLNRVTPANASWNGGNSSGWKSDIIGVNGMNEQMGYGGQDRELGERLINSGKKGKQLRYTAICLHLDHPRSYKTDNSIIKNQKIRKHTKQARISWTPHGIQKDEA